MVSRSSALTVATFCALLPALIYTGTLLTEVALYPIFLLALLGITAALERPTGRLTGARARGHRPRLRDEDAHGRAGPGVRVRDAPARRRRPAVGWVGGPATCAHSTALGLFAAMAAVGLVVPAALGHGPAALGKYGVVLGHIDLSGTAVWFVLHLAALDLYVAVAPFGASLVLVWLGLRARRRASGAGALRSRDLGVPRPRAPGRGRLLLEAARGRRGYAPTGARLHERNVFVLVPLLLIGLALYFELGRPGARSVKVVCFGIAAALPLLLPIPDLIHNANLQALTVIPWGAESIRGLWPLTFLPLAALALVALVGRRSSAVFAWALVAAAFTVTTVAANAYRSTRVSR